jgi:uncharacterized membrane protein YbhN (UPF0104 family)
MKNSKRNFIIILVIAFIVMVFSFKNDYKNIIESFSRINVLWLLIGIGVMVIYHFMDAYFIYYFCKRHNSKYTMVNGWAAEQTGVFFSAITPFSSGGQFAQVAVLKKQGISSSVSASMLMISFISWQIILVVVGFLVLVCNYVRMIDIFSQYFNIVLLGFAVNFVVIVSLFLLSFSKHFHHFIFNKIIPLLGKMRILKNVDEKKYQTEMWLKMFRDDFNTLLLHPNMMFRRLVTDFFKIITLYSLPFFAAKALNVDIAYSQITMVIIMSSFVYMITAVIPSPGGAGGTEGVFALLMKFIFLGSTTSVMLMWRILSYYLPMIVSFGIFANIKKMSLNEGLE